MLEKYRQKLSIESLAWLFSSQKNIWKQEKIAQLFQGGHNKNSAALGDKSSRTNGRDR